MRLALTHGYVLNRHFVADKKWRISRLPISYIGREHQREHQISTALVLTVLSSRHPVRNHLRWILGIIVWHSTEDSSGAEGGFHRVDRLSYVLNPGHGHTGYYY